MRFLPSQGSSSAHETSPLPVHTSVGGCRAGDVGGWDDVDVKGDWRELRRYVSRGSRMYRDKSVVDAAQGWSSGLPLGRAGLQDRFTTNDKSYRDSPRHEHTLNHRLQVYASPCLLSAGARVHIHLLRRVEQCRERLGRRGEVVPDEHWVCQLEYRAPRRGMDTPGREWILFGARAIESLMIVSLSVVCAGRSTSKPRRNGRCRACNTTM